MQTIISSPAEQRVVLRHVSWDTYERLLADYVSSSVPHFTYDRGLLEIMSPSAEHEMRNRALATLIEVVTEEIDLDVLNVGSTTFRRRDLERGFEADSSFYIEHASRIRGKKEIDPAVDPPPDLVIEIDSENSSLPKLPIFARMGVPEVWRDDGDRVAIYRLDQEEYRVVAASVAIPLLTGDDLTRFLIESRSGRRLDWVRSLRGWVRDRQADRRQIALDGEPRAGGA